MSTLKRIPNGAHYRMTDPNGRDRYYMIDDSGLLRYYSKSGVWRVSALSGEPNDFALKYLIENCEPIQDKK